MFGFVIGWQEAIIILVIVLIIFGPGKLPSIGKALGETVRNFRKSASETDTDNGNEKKEQ